MEYRLNKIIEAIAQEEAQLARLDLERQAMSSYSAATTVEH
jgi:hypothetical protein